MKLDFYDPNFIAQEGIKLKAYPNIIEGNMDIDQTRLTIVGIIKKDGQVFAVDVVNPAVRNLFVEGCCRVPHGVSQGDIGYYAISKELLNGKSKEDRIIVPEKDFSASVGRSAA